MAIAKTLLALLIGVGAAVAPTIFRTPAQQQQQPFGAASFENHQGPNLEVQAHRGGAGMHAESMLCPHRIFLVLLF